MSQDLTELSALLIEETFGRLASRLYHTLIIHGRCSLSALVSQSGLPLPQARHGLSVLIQHHLVYWHTAAKATTYEPDITAAYNLARHGKCAQIAEDRLGTLAGRLVSHLLQVGHARYSDLLHAFNAEEANAHTVEPASTTPLSNGVLSKGLKDNGRISREGELYPDKAQGSLRDLLQAGFVRKIHMSHFRTAADNRMEAEKLVKPIGESKGTKKERAALWDRALRKLLCEWKYGGEYEKVDPVPLPPSRKRRRKPSDQQETVKRPRMNGVLGKPVASHGIPTHQTDDSSSEKLQPDPVLSINHAKFAILLRSDRLVGLVEQLMCQATAKVYRKVLDKIEPHLRECRPGEDDGADEDDFDDQIVTTEEIANAVPESEDLQDALGSVEEGIDDQILDNPKKRRRKVTARGKPEHEGESSGTSDIYTGTDESGISNDEEEEMAEGESNPDPRGLGPISFTPHNVAVRSHLRLLAQHSLGLLKRVRSRFVTSESWTVNFPALVKAIQNQEIAQVISSRYGSHSMRLVNILLEHGKLDDKTLSSLSLIKEKELRPRLTAMQKAGFLGVQEVPRDNARIASRTTFLFFVDRDRCVKKLTDECYKTITRLLERGRGEKEVVEGTLEKASRSDVVGREEELLSKPEREAIQHWKDIEERLWCQMQRIDDMVALFRDF